MTTTSTAPTTSGTCPGARLREGRKADLVVLDRGDALRRIGALPEGARARRGNHREEGALSITDKYLLSFRIVPKTPPGRPETAFSVSSKSGCAKATPFPPRRPGGRPGSRPSGRLKTGRLKTGRLKTGRLNTGRLNTGRLNTGRLKRSTGESSGVPFSCFAPAPVSAPSAPDLPEAGDLPIATIPSPSPSPSRRRPTFVRRVYDLPLPRSTGRPSRVGSGNRDRNSDRNDPGTRLLRTAERGPIRRFAGPCRSDGGWWRRLSGRPLARDGSFVRRRRDEVCRVFHDPERRSRFLARFFVRFPEGRVE